MLSEKEIVGGWHLCIKVWYNISNYLMVSMLMQLNSLQALSKMFGFLQLIRQVAQEETLRLTSSRRIATKTLRNRLNLWGPTKQIKQLIVQVGHEKEKDRLLRTMIGRSTELFFVARQRHL